MKKLVAILILLVLLSAGALFHFSATASTATDSGYDLSWWTVDGGGTTSNKGSNYSLGGTVGQPDAAVWSGGDYTLAGGFWGGVVVEYRIYLPLVLRG